jgi:hypothetical protein
MKLSSLAAHVVFATALLGTHAAANAQSANYGPPGVAVWQYCYAEELTSFPNRVHVYCPYVMSSFKYIAVPTSSSAEAGRLIALASAAMTMNRGLWFLVNTQDTSATSFGCAAHDCRRPLEIKLERPFGS